LPWCRARSTSASRLGLRRSRLRADGFVSSIESIGDVEAICEGTAGRRASDAELKGAVAADGVGTALAAVFGAMPNTTFSQNVGLIAITGMMSRHVVTLGAVFLILCGRRQDRRRGRPRSPLKSWAAG